MSTEHLVLAGCLVPASQESRHRFDPLDVASRAALSDIYSCRSGAAPDALRFANRWGGLGYSRISDGRESLVLEALGLPGAIDPLPWFWAHVNGIRVAMDLIGCLRVGDHVRLTRVLEALRLPQAVRNVAEEAAGFRDVYWVGGRLALREFDRMVEAELSRWAQQATDALVHCSEGEAIEQAEQPDSSLAGPLLGLFRDLATAEAIPERSHFPAHGLVFGRRSGVVTYVFPPTSQQSAADVATSVLEEIIDPNLVGVRDHLVIEPISDSAEAGGSDLHARVEARADSLLSGIYRHLLQTLTGELRRCAECNAPFVVDHQGRWFCPKGPYDPRSRCEMKFNRNVQRGDPARRRIRAEIQAARSKR